MAEVIESMPPKRGGYHDWETLLDGRRWKLTRGEDYDCTEAMMADRAKKAAKRRGLRVTVSWSYEKRHVCLQALREG
jgi:hypothetical protein